MADSPQIDGSATVLLEIDRFEHFAATGGRVLLRVDGQYTERPGRRILDATLYVDDGLAVHRHAPLPDPDLTDGVWLWRAAFAVPSAYLTDARMSFALESDPSLLIDLGMPVPSRIGTAPATSLRGARIARRYAAAIAVVLTVAVSPGSLPASARTDILRVRRADGTTVYLNSAGQPVEVVPADAVIVDQGAPAAPALVPPTSVPQPDSAAAAQPAATPAAPQGASQPTPAAPPAQPAPAAPAQAQAPAAAPAPVAVAAAAQQQQPAPAHHKAPGSHRHGHSTSTHRHAHSHRAYPHARREIANTLRPQHAPHRAAPVVRAPETHPQGTTGGVAAPAGATISLGAPSLQPTSSLGSDAGPAPAPGLKPLSALDLGRGPQTAIDPPARVVSTHPTGVEQSPQPIQPAQPAPPVAPSAPPLEAPSKLPSSGSGGGPGIAPPTPAPVAQAVGGGAQRHSGDHAPAQRPAPQAPQVHPLVPLRTVTASPAPVAGVTTTTDTGSAAPALGAFPNLPTTVTSVPNLVLTSFRIPPFLLPIYQAAGVQYGIRWEVLAAINEIETNYGRDLSVSSAGALGWMQFMPDTWKTYGVDATGSGSRDPFNPVDAIFSAARYLKAAGGDRDIRTAVFAYNHATWYVDSVMLRARLIAAYPPDLIGALTGLTQGRFPIAAPSHYAGDQLNTGKRVSAGQNAADVVSSSPNTSGLDIYSHAGAPVIASGDGVVKQIGRSRTRGNFVVLQDVYGNRYTYSHLGSLAKLYPVPNPTPPAATKATTATASAGSAALDPAPHAAATAGRQAAGKSAAAPKVALVPVAGLKHRLFAHPSRPLAARSGGLDQIMSSQPQKFATYDGYFAHALGLNSHNATLKPLRKGSAVIATTVLGRVGRPGGKGAPRIHFEIRPAGNGAPQIDPKPIVDGWKLLESTAVYSASGKTALYGSPNDLTIGQIMLLPKRALERRVLADPRVKIYPGGRQDVKTGQVDRRVLEVLEYLAASGLNPTVSALKSGHSELTSAGNVSEHASGNAVDISAINDIPVSGHQNQGGIADQAVRGLMTLQGAIAPHQIISLLSLGQNTLALPDHADHIHVGFRPLLGDNAGLGQQAHSVLAPDQWNAFAAHLGQIDNPLVPTQPSKYALPDH